MRVQSFTGTLSVSGFAVGKDGDLDAVNVCNVGERGGTFGIVVGVVFVVYPEKRANRPVR